MLDEGGVPYAAGAVGGIAGSGNLAGHLSESSSSSDSDTTSDSSTSESDSDSDGGAGSKQKKNKKVKNMSAAEVCLNVTNIKVLIL